MLSQPAMDSAVSGANLFFGGFGLKRHEPLRSRMSDAFSGRGVSCREAAPRGNRMSRCPRSVRPATSLRRTRPGGLTTGFSKEGEWQGEQAETGRDLHGSETAVRES